MATVVADPSPPGEQKGLKANAIGFLDALVIGIAEVKDGR